MLRLKDFFTKYEQILFLNVKQTQIVTEKKQILFHRLKHIGEADSTRSEMNLVVK